MATIIIDTSTHLLDFTVVSACLDHFLLDLLPYTGYTYSDSGGGGCYVVMVVVLLLLLLLLLLVLLLVLLCLLL